MTSLELGNKYTNEVELQLKHEVMSGDGASHPAR
jgi:hypothetical protein